MDTCLLMRSLIMAMMAPLSEKAARIFGMNTGRSIKRNSS